MTMTNTIPVAMTAIEEVWTSRFQRLRGVMNRPSPLDANGLPYVFTRFEGSGFVTDDDAVESGEPAKIDVRRFVGPHERELPLNDEVVDFE